MKYQQRKSLFILNWLVVFSMIVTLIPFPAGWGRARSLSASSLEAGFALPVSGGNEIPSFALPDPQSAAIERALGGVVDDHLYNLPGAHGIELLPSLPAQNLGVTQANFSANRLGDFVFQTPLLAGLPSPEKRPDLLTLLNPQTPVPAVANPAQDSLLSNQSGQSPFAIIEQNREAKQDAERDVLLTANRKVGDFFQLPAFSVAAMQWFTRGNGREIALTNTIHKTVGNAQNPFSLATSLYLPYIVNQSALHNREQAVLLPNQANFISFDNGRVQLTAMAGAVAQLTVVIFMPQPADPIEGYAATLSRFSLNAYANGAPVTHFNAPLALSVAYDAQSGVDPERLHIFYFDEDREVWTAVPSQVDGVNGRVQATLDHFTDFALLMTNSCDDLLLAPIPEAIQPAFVQACQRVGPAIIGPQISSGYPWGGSWGVTFLNGDLVYNTSEADAYFIQSNLSSAYRAAGGPDSFLGMPTMDTNPDGPPGTFRDENRDFRGNPYNLFDSGFVGISDGTASAHRFFPRVLEVFVLNQTVDDDFVRVAFGASVDPAPESTATAKARIVVEFSNGITWTQSTTGGPQSVSFTYPDPIPVTSTLTANFYWDLARTDVEDALIGYAPCLYFDHQQKYGPVRVIRNDIYRVEVNCETNPPFDVLPPTIEFIEIWPDGRGNLSILAAITDDSGVIASATIEGAPGIFSPLVEWAPGIYGATVSKIPNNQVVNFTVTASDPSGNTATASGNSRSPFRGLYGLNCIDPCTGWDRAVGNPVIPSSGAKAEQLPVVTVPGPGQADIEIILSYSSQNSEVGVAGQGWSFPYKMSLTPRNNPLLIGVEVFYPDGRQVLFADNDDGTYTAVTPDIHDRLVETGDGYTLIRKSLDEFDFSSDGQLIAQRDRNGNEIQFSYSGDQLTAISNDAGRAVTISYEGEFINAIAAPEGKLYQFSYTETRLTGFTDARGGEWAFEYEENYIGTLLNVDAEEYEAYDYYLTRVVTPEGREKNRQTYDERGRVTEQWVGGREHRAFVYDEEALTTTVTDAFDNVTVYQYDELKRLIRLDHANGAHELFDYDDDFNRIYHRDQNGREWHYTFDSRGNRLTEDGPMGWHREWDYNDLDRVTRMEDALRRETNLEYDDRGNLTKITRPDDSFSTILYDDRGLPTDIYDFNGNHTRNEYDSVTGDLLRSWDAEAHLTQFTYDGLGRVTRAILPNNAAWEYGYDENDNLISLQGPLDYAVTYSFDSDNNLIRETDPNGGEIFYQHDQAGKLIEIQDQADGSTGFVYDEMNNLVEMRDAEGRVWTFAYDAVYNRTAEHGPEDTHTLYEHDGLGNVTAITRCQSAYITGACAEGETTRLVYDDLNRVKEMIENYTPGAPAAADINVITRFEYDLVGNLTRLVDANNHATQFTYDLLDRLTREEDAEGQITRYAYDPQGNLTELRDAEERVWTFVYDRVYNLTAEHGPEDSHTLFTYDGVGNMLTQTRCNSPLVGDSCPVGQTTRYEYDPLNRVERLVQNDVADAPSATDVNVTTLFAYDLAGNLLLLTDANGNETAFRYDDLHRLVYQIDAEDQEIWYAYDKVGNLIALINPREYSAYFEYDGLDRLVLRRDARDSEWEYRYDRLSNLISVVDSHGVITHYEYDGLSRIRAITENYAPDGPATAEQNVITRFAHDRVGNLRFVYDPRGEYVTEHRYDRVNRRILTIDNENGETAFVYDKVGNLVTIIDGNGYATVIRYDDLNRQVEIINPEDHAVQFEYDRLSNLVNLTDARGNATAFFYDGMNRVVLTVDALEGEWRNEYDAMGNLLRHTDANGHINNSYTYDKVYRVLSITDAEGHTNSFSYDANGNRLTWTDGNDHTTTYTYNELDWLASVTNAEEETTEYRYDLVGNQTHLIEADGIVTLYGYDPLYRLTAVTLNHRPDLPASVDTNVVTGYEYDEVGNLVLIVDGNGHETQFSYDGMNRLAREIDADFHVWEYAYDPVGNRTARIDANGYRTDYDYYPDNQLRQISYEMDGTTVLYFYDENNNQTMMVDHLGTTTWEYDQLNRIARVNDALGRVLLYGYDAVGNRASLTYPDGRSVTYTYYDNNWLETAVDPENNVTHYQRDGVGNPLLITNPNDTVAEMAYDRANRLLTLVNRQTSGAQKTNSAFSYTYNEIGHRVAMTAEYAWRNPSIVHHTYIYDGLRRLVREETSQGVWTEYEFDYVGNRLVLRTNDSPTTPRPFDQQTLHYSYSKANRLLTVVGDTHPGQPSTKRVDNVGQAIHAFHHETTALNGKHIHPIAAAHLLTMAQALIDLLEGSPAPAPGAVAAAIAELRGEVEAYRDLGLIKGAGIANSLLVKLNLGDQANNGASGDLQTQTFSYDNNGNRINKEFPGPRGPQIQGTDYSYDPENRLITAQDYQMNQQGNRVERGVTDMAYDGGGRRLVKSYDPKVGGGGAKQIEYVFDGWDPVAEYNSWNPQYSNYYRGGGGRILTMHNFPAGTQGQMYWFHYDGLGSVSGLTKHQGQSHHNYRYHAYGQIEMPPGNFTDPHNHYTFTGQEWDENTGLYEFYARKYDPITGGWLSQDPYRGTQRLPASLHRYQYAYNNPTSYVDLHGYVAWIPVIILVVGITAMATTPAYAPASEQDLATLIEEYDHGPQKFGRDLVISTLFEPYDWYLTCQDIYENGFHWSHTLGVIPFVPGTMSRASRKIDTNSARKLTNSIDDLSDWDQLISPQRRKHILDGDATGGGHRHGTGISGKSEFPSSWTDRDIVENIIDVATDPNSTVIPSHSNRSVVRGTKNGVDIEVIIDNITGDIITGYPTNIPRNP